VEVLDVPTQRWQWLSSNIDEFVADGKVLVFVSSKADTEDVAKQLTLYFIARQLDIGVAFIHGDKDQTERMNIIKQFSKKDGTTILVATDVASRGLDIKDIRTVINYTTPKNIETYVHRIGRTGRMGIDGVTPGTAYSLLTNLDSSFAVDLVQNLKLSSQPVPSTLQKLAESDPKWMKLKHGFHSNNHNTGSSGKVVGIGFGDPNKAPRAMTSELLAQASSQPISAFVASNISKYNSKYSQSIPNSNNTSSHLKSSIDINTPGNTSSQHSSLTPSSSLTDPPIKRKSRFSAPEPAPVLPGFVKSTAIYSSICYTSSSISHHSPNSNVVVADLDSISNSNVASHQDEQLNTSIRKKSRWDN
jgi:ATP-dependent RNA helicase DDX42